jgi:hypothetical protein
MPDQFIYFIVIEREYFPWPNGEGWRCGPNTVQLPNDDRVAEYLNTMHQQKHWKLILGRQQYRLAGHGNESYENTQFARPHNDASSWIFTLGRKLFTTVRALLSKKSNIAGLKCRIQLRETKPEPQLKLSLCYAESNHLIWIS